MVITPRDTPAPAPSVTSAFVPSTNSPPAPSAVSTSTEPGSFSVNLACAFFSSLSLHTEDTSLHRDDQNDRMQTDDHPALRITSIISPHSAQPASQASQAGIRHQVSQSSLAPPRLPPCLVPQQLAANQSATPSPNTLADREAPPHTLLPPHIRANAIPPLPGMQSFLPPPGVIAFGSLVAQRGEKRANCRDFRFASDNLLSPLLPGGFEALPPVEQMITVAEMADSSSRMVTSNTRRNNPIPHSTYRFSLPPGCNPGRTGDRAWAESRIQLVVQLFRLLHRDHNWDQATANAFVNDKASVQLVTYNKRKFVDITWPLGSPPITHAKFTIKSFELMYLGSGALTPLHLACIRISGVKPRHSVQQLLDTLDNFLMPHAFVLEAWQECAKVQSDDTDVLVKSEDWRFLVSLRQSTQSDEPFDGDPDQFLFGLPGFVEVVDFVYRLKYVNRFPHCAQCRLTTNVERHQFNQCTQFHCKTCNQSGHMAANCPNRNAGR